MLKIIACDDDVAFLDRLHRMIDRWSTETGTAVDVALVTRGEDLLARHAASRADIILLDMIMPLVNGMDTARELLALADGMPAVRCAVVHPCDVGSLSGAMDSARHGLIVPVLIGPAKRIRLVATEANIDLDGVEIIDVEHSHAAAQMGAGMAARGEVEVIMKGSLHTDEMVKAVLAEHSLRTGRRMSHVFRFDVPLYPKPLLITDAARNSNRLPVNANGEVRLRSVLSSSSVGICEMPLILNTFLASKRIASSPLLAASLSSTADTCVPRKVEMIAGGASLAPRRCAFVALMIAALSRPLCLCTAEMALTRKVMN